MKKQRIDDKQYLTKINGQMLNDIQQTSKVRRNNYSKTSENDKQYP